MSGRTVNGITGILLETLEEGGVDADVLPFSGSTVKLLGYHPSSARN